MMPTRPLGDLGGPDTAQNVFLETAEEGRVYKLF